MEAGRSARPHRAAVSLAAPERQVQRPALRPGAAVLTAAVQDGYQEWLTAPIVALGESFLKPFDSRAYPHKHYGAFFCTDTWLSGVDALALEFGADFSPILWDTIASLGTRENPLEEDTILNVQGELPYAWGICDAALHALGKTYGLFLHVQERLRRHSGHVLMHDCGCSHALQDILEVSGSFPLLKPEEPVYFKMKKAWLDHFMGELYLMFVDGFPFRMNPEDFNSTKVISLR